MPAAAVAGLAPEHPADDTPTLTMAAVDVRDEDPSERTQVIPMLPAARDEITRDLRDALMPRMEDRADATQMLRPGEQTQVIFRRPPSEADRAQAAADQAARDRAAQERSRQAFRDLAAQERARQAFAERAAREARQQGEETQVINIAAYQQSSGSGTGRWNRPATAPRCCPSRPSHRHPRRDRLRRTGRR